MQTLTRAVMVLVMLAAANVRPAQASWLAFYEYLEQLSGPGWFIGPAVEWPMFCNDRMVSVKCGLEPDQLAKTNRWFELAPRFARVDAVDPGDLAYEGEPPHVAAWLYGATVTIWMTPMRRPGEISPPEIKPAPKRLQLGVTGSASAINFVGGDVTADARIARVGPILRYQVGRRWIFVTPQLQVYFNSFDRRDFGAAAGRRLHEPVNFHVQAGVMF